MKQFSDIRSQIEKISGEVSGYGSTVSSMSVLNLDEQDLSVRKIMEYQSKLRALQKEKVCKVLRNKHVKFMQNVFPIFSGDEVRESTFSASLLSSS